MRLLLQAEEKVIDGLLREGVRTPLQMGSDGGPIPLTKKAPGTKDEDPVVIDIDLLDTDTPPGGLA